MGMGTGRWTKAINSISEKLNSSKIANNKYFNYKDAGVIGIAGASAVAAYYGSGGDEPSVANGLITGLGVGVMARYAVSGRLGKSLESSYNAFSDSNMGRMLNLEGGKEFGKTWKTNTTAIVGGSIAGMTAIGALGGAVNHEIDDTITAKSGAIEGASIAAMTLGLAAVSGSRYGGAARIAAAGVPGMVGAGVGLAYGAYEGGHGDDGGVWKATVRGIAFAKIGKSLAMYGSERYMPGKLTEGLKKAGL
jgi:hypothetical protein